MTDRLSTLDLRMCECERKRERVWVCGRGDPWMANGETGRYMYAWTWMLAWGGGGERCMMHKGLARSSPVRVVCNVMSFLYYYCMSSCVGLVGGMLNFMNGCMAWSCETGLLLGTHRTRVFTLTLPIYPFQADWLALGYKINT